MDWSAPIPLVTLDEFLVRQEWCGLLDYTLDRCDHFTNTGVLNDAGAPSVDTGYRRSRAIFDIGNYRQLFANRLMTFLPHVRARLGLDEFAVTDIEIQLTATNDGEFFRVHSDNRSDAVSSRALTFVYYFYREPKAFVGGELRVYANGGGAYRVAYPLQNQIVFFPSETLHEVLPVECPSGDFADSRFTVNGWLHR